MEKKYILMKTDSGEWTTILKENKHKFPGREFGPESKGAARWDKEEALGIQKYGEAYIDIPGNYEGKIAMVNEEGQTHAADQKNVQEYLNAGHKLGNKKNLQL